MEDRTENNLLRLRGKALTAPEFSHKAYGEAFFRFILGADRRSGYTDRIPALVSQRLLRECAPEPGELCELLGQIRTYNEPLEGRSRLHITAFAREFQLLTEDDIKLFSEPVEDHLNQVILSGFLCKEPIYRKSPMGRDICDLMLAVNRMYGKSDYIPCIAWGRNALYTAGLTVGAPLKLEGRIQSRIYTKKDPAGGSEERTAYEVSILKIED